MTTKDEIMQRVISLRAEANALEALANELPENMPVRAEIAMSRLLRMASMR